MADIPKTALEMQIEQETKELEAVPKVPIAHFFGSHSRCHFCGALCQTEDLKAVDSHIQGQQRLACQNCDPLRGIHGR